MRTEQSHEEGRAIPRLLAWVAGCCGRRPWLVLAGAVLSCALCLYANFTFLDYQTHRNDLLSPQKDSYQRWQHYVAEFGDDDDMVVVVRGKDRPSMQHALHALACEVSAQPERFDRLFYKVDLTHLRNRALLYLPTQQIEEIRANVQKMDQLLQPPLLAQVDPLAGWKLLSLQWLVIQAQQRVKSLEPDAPARDGAPLAVAPRTSVSVGDEQFFHQLEAICQNARFYLADANAYRSPWLSILPSSPDAGQEDQLAQPQFFFSGDGTLAFLLVRPIKQTDSFTTNQKSVTSLRELIARVAARYPDLHFGLTGLPVLETDEMVASQKDAMLASWLALAGVALLYLVVYRGLRYPMMTVATLLVGTVWALGWTTLTVGHLNILSAAFAVMLIGMGDYGVLWITRYGQERQSGADLPAAMRQTALSVGPGILTAAVTTAVAFYATMLADFRAIAELGWIAGSGVLLCALSCFTVMPALLAIFDFRFERRPLIPLDEARAERALWLPWVARRPRLVVVASLAITAVLAILAAQVRYDHNLLNLQAQSLESVKWEHVLIEHTAGASWHALSWTATPEEALDLKARYERLAGVSRVVEVASLVPGDQEDKLRLLADIQQRLRRLPEPGQVLPHPRPDPATVSQSLRELREAIARSLHPENTPATVTRLYHQLEALEKQLATLDADVAACRLQEFDQCISRDLADDLHRLRDVSTPATIAVTDLPDCLRERYIGRTGKWLVRVFGKECLWDFQPLRLFCQEIHPVDPTAAGKPFTTLDGLRELRNGFLWAGLYALLAMLAILLLDFRNWKHTLLALAPLFMGMIFALGVMTLCGLPLNPANMIAIPLILGVGADNGVHVLHDYRSRGTGLRYHLSHSTGRGIMVAALTTVLGFGTLMISTHRGMSSLGLMLTLGVSCCMLTALIFLPALLRLQSTRRQIAERAQSEPRRRAA